MNELQQETEGASLSDRRWVRRSLSSWDTIVIDPTKAVEGRLVNISTAGCCFLTRSRFRSGDRVELIILYSAEARPLRVTGALVRWVTGEQVGVAFETLSSHVRRDLERGLSTAGLKRQRC